MKKILIITISLFFIFNLSAQDTLKRHRPHEKISWSKIKSNKDSTTYKVIKGNKTFYQTRKRVWDVDLKDSVWQTTFPKSIK